MAKIDEISIVAKLGIMLAIAGLGVGAAFYGLLNPKIDANKQLQVQVKARMDENTRLGEFETKLPLLKQQLAELQQQLANQRLVVPDEKEADKFIKLLHDTGASAGIEIRRYTALPTVNREYYSEVPFTIDIDGPYFSVLGFFERIAKMERIVNINSLQMASTKATGPAKVKGTYTYAPGESVVASCNAVTFYNHEAPPAPAAPAVKK
ncbi:MAG TPA: type 4a pilus biogenesis protein PilO [Candidatus Saccharimonadales bacterium]|jgi:type IV pilus assembly protein PilO|nr:type 4a pilus biogenesis protein PilO [Candidatus Saccharimonadales bacterium]